MSSWSCCVASPICSQLHRLLPALWRTQTISIRRLMALRLYVRCPTDDCLRFSSFSKSVLRYRLFRRRIRKSDRGQPCLVSAWYMTAKPIGKLCKPGCRMSNGCSDYHACRGPRQHPWAGRHTWVIPVWLHLPAAVACNCDRTDEARLFCYDDSISLRRRFRARCCKRDTCIWEMPSLFPTVSCDMSQ